MELSTSSCKESKLCKTKSSSDNNDVNCRGALTNFVPAVAVKRRGRVFFVLTGRKECVEG
jgi:hypothetical protein